MLTVAAIVGHDVEVVADCAKLVLVEEEVFRASTDDDVCGDTLPEGPFDLWEYGCDTDAASDEEEAFQFTFLMFFNQFTWFAQWADDCVEVISFVHLSQLARGLTDDLEYDDDGLPLIDDVADGKRYSLSVFMRNDDDKLSRLAAKGYPRGMDLHAVDLVAVE